MTAAEAADAARAVEPLLPASLRPFFTPGFIGSDRRHDAFVTRLCLGTVRETGIAGAAASAATAVEIARRAGLDPERAPVAVEWLLRRLASRGFIDTAPSAAPADGAGGAVRYTVARPLPALDPADLRDEQQRDDPAWLPSYTLSETVARDYPAFLRGERAGEDVLFTAARLRLWAEYFSNDNPLYAVNNRVGAAAAAAWCPPGPLSILEVGGGLGSGAAALLDGLKAAGRLKDVDRYRFTDAVPVFVRRGQLALERQWPDVPSLTFGGLDMNRPFAEQGVPAASCALVYGVNTFHVARDLRFTLGEAFAALRPGGVLVMAECIRPTAGETVHAEFVFNLLESFRSPRLDPAYRPTGGFLTPAHWRAAIETSGFRDVRFLPDIERVHTAFPQFLVAAVGATRP
jgi:SAM-dependent methyltransferase